MVYKWKTYSYKTDANIVGKVCEDLNNTVGLTPQNLVDASRAEDAPLHKEFEWDDAVAAEGFRKQQAALMISNLAVVIEQKKEEPVRAFFSLGGGFRKGGEKFEGIIEILKNDEKRETLLEKARNELKAFRHKYSLLQELETIFSAIDAELEKEVTNDGVSVQDAWQAAEQVRE